MPLFPVLLLVLGLGDVLVALHSLGRLARLVEIQLTGVLGAHGNVREQALEIGALALWTGRGVAGPQELLELMAAAPALVFVDRHWVDYTNSQIPNPKSQTQFRTQFRTAKAAPHRLRSGALSDSRRAKVGKTAKTAVWSVGSWELSVVRGYTEHSSGRGSAW